MEKNSANNDHPINERTRNERAFGCTAGLSALTTPAKPMNMTAI